jgi:hypothetical protein
LDHGGFIAGKQKTNCIGSVIAEVESSGFKVQQRLA